MPIDWTTVAMSAEAAVADLFNGAKATGDTLTAGVANIFAVSNLTVSAYQPASAYTATGW
ncbi:hypothetical protein [Hydrogenophaga sp.]|uniref:hypothetical protein n=1 Tax=Hydrogenophaga sp. TaxID=1904254 RepID=UPI003F6B604F